MTDTLKQYGLVYLATPYSKYPGGLGQAFVKAAEITARLLQRGVKAYSPIAHTHPVAVFGNVDPYDHDIWLPFDQAIMERSDAIAVVMLPTWEASKGITFEIDFFNKHGKPVHYLCPETLRVQ